MGNTEIVISRNETSVRVFTNSDLTKDSNPMARVIIYDGGIYSEAIYWDNINYFLELDDKKKSEIIQELSDKGQYYPKVIDDIEYLVDRIQKMGLI